MENSFLKAIVTGFAIMMQVILIICLLDFYPSLNDTDKFLWGFIGTIATLGCMMIAVGINTINDKG